MALLMQPFCRGLTDDRHDRRAIHIGVGKPCDKVGRARTKRCKADACPACEPAIGIGHEGRPLLVSAQDEFDRAVDQRNHQIRIFFTRDPEDPVNPFRFKTFYK